jgi:hypothetical protein
MSLFYRLRWGKDRMWSRNYFRECDTKLLSSSNSRRGGGRFVTGRT